MADGSLMADRLSSRFLRIMRLLYHCLVRVRTYHFGTHSFISLYVRYGMLYLVSLFCCTTGGCTDVVRCTLYYYLYIYSTVRTCCSLPYVLNVFGNLLLDISSINLFHFRGKRLVWKIYHSVSLEPIPRIRKILHLIFLWTYSMIQNEFEIVRGFKFAYIL